MNTLRKGLVGEIAVYYHLVSNYEYNIYFPHVDDHGVDLLVERDPNDYVKVQVKTLTEPNHNSAAEVRLKDIDKKGRFDVLALYVLSIDKIAFIPYEKNRRSYNLAISPAKNNQRKDRNWFYEYLMFPLK